MNKDTQINSIKESFNNTLNIINSYYNNQTLPCIQTREPLTVDDLEEFDYLIQSLRDKFNNSLKALKID
jgi:hypothetical protein